MYIFLYFDANGGSGTVPDRITTTSGDTLTIPSSSLTRAGYTFDGWNTASDGSGTAYAPGSTITIYNDVILYAQWKKSSVFDISSDGNCVAFFGTAIDGLTSPKLIINGELAFGTAASAAATRANLGLTGVETKTLLWTNASPTSVFAAQTISLDLSGYDTVEIVSQFITSNVGQTVEKCEFGSRVFVEKFYNATSTSAHATIMHRQIDVNPGGVAFADAKSKVVDENTSTTNNSLLIPYKIYGIKVV